MKKRKRNRSSRVRVALAVLAAIILVGGAYLAGCTTINIPADDARPASFNGINVVK